MKNVSLFPASTSMTMEQALASAQQFHEVHGLSEVMIAGYDKNGSFVIRTSHMSRAEALFLSEIIKRHAIDGAT